MEHAMERDLQKDERTPPGVCNAVGRGSVLSLSLTLAGGQQQAKGPEQTGGSGKPGDRGRGARGSARR
jgi:hypothetical protein